MFNENHIAMKIFTNKIMPAKIIKETTANILVSFDHTKREILIPKKHLDSFTANSIEINNRETFMFILKS